MRLRSMWITTLVLITVLMMAGTAIADTNDMWTDPSTQAIGVGGNGTYTVYVNTSELSEHTIGFNTLNPDIIANLTGNGGTTGALAQTGNFNWTPTHTDGWAIYTFTYNVYPQCGGSLVEGTEYQLRLTDGYIYGYEMIDAAVIISTTVVPELTTFALVSIGLIGLVALRRRKE